MEFSILGPIQVCRDGEQLPMGGARETSVLALMLLNEGRPTPAERLIDAVWGDPPPSARAQLHNLISRMRARPYGDLIITHPVGYALRLGAHGLDVVDFRRSVKQGRELIAGGDHEGAVAALSRAISLWRGPALSGVPGEFADAARQTLEEERLLAVEELCRARLATGGHADVLRDLPELIAEHPYRENLHEVHMLALAAAGRQAEALDAYRAIYRMLDDELGVEPGQALRETEQRILRGEVSSAVRTLEVSRLVPREIPPIPATLTGREKLIAAVSADLRGGPEAVSPVAVLAGAGGIGKTTLACAVAYAVAADFPGGQLFADMRGSHDDPAQAHAVAGRFLSGLGVDGSLLPHDPQERLALYRSTLADRRVLVVLDDVLSEEQVRPLLPGDAGCATLVTTRRQLGGLIGAARFPVPVLARADAIELLARTVGRERVAAEPEAALDIVDTCGHLPLATCIAATRLAVRLDWTLTDFKQRLASQRRRLDELAVGDLDVRASIGLSYEALQPRLRALFRRLGLITAPDWPLWVAEVLGKDPAIGDEPVDRLLDQLVDVHLVEPLGRDALGQERFRLHDLVAQFAREAAEAEDHPVVIAHAEGTVADAWLGLAADADPLLGHGMSLGDGISASSPPPPTAWRTACQAPRAWFEVERINLVNAVRTACRLGRADLASGLVLRLYGFFVLGGHRYDQERSLRDVLALAPGSGDDRLRMRLLLLHFNVCVMRDLNSELPSLAAEYLRLARQLGDRRHEIFALKQSGLAARRLGRLGEAARWNQQALASCDDDTPKDVRALVLAGVAALYFLAGQSERGVPFAERMLEIQRTLTQPHQTATRLNIYAEVLMDVGRFDEAEQAVREAMEILAGVADVANHAYSEHVLACIDMARGEWDRAAAGLARSREVFAGMGDRLGVADILRLEADLAILRGNLGGALGPLEQALAICRELDVPLELARLLARLELVLADVDSGAAQRYRREYKEILAATDADERCLRLPVV